MFFKCAGIKVKSCVRILSISQEVFSVGPLHADTIGRNGTSCLWSLGRPYNTGVREWAGVRSF